jgi:hypothetical protein
MARFVSPITDMKPNGSLRFFKSGTSTPLTTYKDDLETIANAAVVPVLPNGNVENVFYSGSAKVVYLDEFGQQYAERDPVGGERELGQFSLWDSVVSYDVNDIVEGSDGNYYISLANGNQGNDPTTTPTQWEQISFLGLWNVNKVYVAGDVVKTSLGNLWKAVTGNSGNDPETDNGTNWLPAIDGSKVPEIIELEARNLWNGESTTFSVLANRKYLIDATGGAVDAALAVEYVAGDEIIVHNNSDSTNTVRLTNTALTIKGPLETITTADNLVLNPGDTAHFSMETTTTGEFV